MSTMRFEGYHVAHLELEAGFSSPGRDQVFLYRSATAWTLLTIALHERYDEQEWPVDGRGVVRARTLSSDELADAVRDRYGQAGWRDLLDAAHDYDPELYRAWVPTRIERDFDQASLHRANLARYAGFFTVEVLPAPGREAPEWPLEAVEAMASHLEDRGFEVTERLGLLDPARDESGNARLGVLTVRRYGFETEAIVRVDDVGEVYVRMADADEVDGAPLRELPALDDEAPAAPEPEPPSLDW